MSVAFYKTELPGVKRTSDLKKVPNFPLYFNQIILYISDVSVYHISLVCQLFSSRTSSSLMWALCVTSAGAHCVSIDRNVNSFFLLQLSVLFVQVCNLSMCLHGGPHYKWHSRETSRRHL